jgi:hypothetical protein
VKGHFTVFLHDAKTIALKFCVTNRESLVGEQGLGPYPCSHGLRLGQLAGKVDECKSCLIGVLNIWETIPEVIVNELNPKLGGYCFVHGSTNVLGGSLLGDARRCGDREVIAGLDFVCVGAIRTWGYERDWSDLVSFLDDDEHGNSARGNDLLFCGRQVGEPSPDWVGSCCFLDVCGHRVNAARTAIL